MNPHRVAAVTRRVFQQFRRDRRTLGLMFVAPLVILGLLYLLVRGGSNRPDVDLVVLDSGPAATAVASSLRSSSTVTVHTVDEATARADVAANRVAGYVLVPADFTQQLAIQHRLSLKIHLEGSQPALAQPVVAAVNQAVAGASGGAAAINVTYEHGGSGFDTLDYFGAAFIGLIVFFLVFVVTVVSFLRERSQGTLERLMASPLSRAELVVGYMLGFGALATVQALEVIVFCLGVLHVHNEGPVWVVVVLSVLMALGAVNLGIFLSMFARTEFQAVQFIPLVIVPQFLLGGVLFPLSAEPGWLQAISEALPLTYGIAGLRDVMLRGDTLAAAAVQLDLAVVFGFAVVAAALAVATLRRRVA